MEKIVGSDRQWPLLTTVPDSVDFTSACITQFFTVLEQSL